MDITNVIPWHPKATSSAKARATAVSAALATAGVAADKIDMKKPEAVTGSGSNAEARRVEVALN